MAEIGTIVTTMLTTAGAVSLFLAETPQSLADHGATPPSNGVGEAPRAALVSNEMRPLKTESSHDGRMYISAEINGQPFRFMVDTAASHSVISEADARRANIPIAGATRVQTAGGNIEAYHGVASSIIFGPNAVREHRILIVKDLPVPLLGMHSLRELKTNYIAM